MHKYVTNRSYGIGFIAHFWWHQCTRWWPLGGVARHYKWHDIINDIIDVYILRNEYHRSKKQINFLDWKCFLLLRLPGISLIESMLTLVGWWNVWRRVILDHMADFDLYPIASLIDVLIASIPFFVLLYIVESSRGERWNKYALILYLRGEK